MSPISDEFFIRYRILNDLRSHPDAPKRLLEHAKTNKSLAERLNQFYKRGLINETLSLTERGEQTFQATESYLEESSKKGLHIKEISLNLWFVKIVLGRD